MIIHPAISFVDLGALVDVLRRVSRGVHGLHASGNPSASCWSITGELVVAPGFVETEQELTVVASDAGEGIPTRIEARLGDRSEDSSLLVLRLSRVLEGAALALRLERVRVGTPLLLVHYPEKYRRPQLSVGLLRDLVGGNLLHDVNTTFGSAGGALFDTDGRLVGMHVSSEKDRTLNRARSLGEILSRLSAAPCWSEIAAYHHLATASPPPSQRGVEARSQQRGAEIDLPLLLPLCLRWSLVASSLDPVQREALRPHVLDSSARVWRVKPEVRRDVFRHAGSLSALRAARGEAPADDPGQRVLDRILQGEPFDLDQEPFAALPFWLQAVRWFEGVVAGLPDAATVHRVTERRRSRERLADIVGEDFQGRGQELERLRAWYALDHAGLIVIWGVGGIGKSALVARFAQKLPGEALLFWLDFDRADLAPDDDAAIVAALSAQYRAQRQGLAPDATEADLLARIASEEQTPLLVLDSFEVAQHASRHEAIWTVLKRFLEAAPRLHLMASGRLAVGGVSVAGRPAEAIPLAGLSTEDASAVLGSHCDRLLHGLAPAEAASKRASYPLFDEATRAQVVERASGSPLLLTLATHLFDRGETIETLPARWTEAFLYQRVLDRLLDPSLKALAKGALVLRRVTEASLAALLSEHLPQGLDAAAAFARLRREVAFFSGGEVLALRPDLRATTLRLLEQVEPDFVREFDLRAAAWYAQQEGDENAAEAVYHALRLGDLTRAEAAWREPLRGALQDAAADLDGEARKWLEARVRDHEPARMSQAEWERDALRRVLGALSRGLTQAAADTLSERQEREASSPLRFYDAWVVLEAGDLVGARAALAGTESLGDEVGWRQRLLMAHVATLQGVHAEADLWLARAEKMGLGDITERAAIVAARLRRTMELGAELRILEQQPPNAARFLTPYDALLPDLRRMLLENRSEVRKSFQSGGLDASFARRWLRDEYTQFSSWPPALRNLFLRLWQEGETAGETIFWAHESTSKALREAGLWLDSFDPVLSVMLAGWRRWAIATRDGALDDLVAIANEELETPLKITSVCMIFLFTSAFTSGIFFTYKGRLIDGWSEDVARKIVMKKTPGRLRTFIDAKDAKLYKELLNFSHAGWVLPGSTTIAEAARHFFSGDVEAYDVPTVILLHFLPDPLELLVRQLAVPSPLTE